MESSERKVYKLTPSSFGFLWEECRRCFYLDVTKGLKRPRMVMPSIFTKIDSAMRHWYEGKSSSVISLDLPAGYIDTSNKSVKSSLIKLPGHHSDLFISGRTDALVVSPSGTGILDFKTSHVRDSNVTKYSRQLHGYAWCFEHPDSGVEAVDISHLGLVVYEPGRYSETDRLGTYALEGKVEYVPIKRDDEQFSEFLNEVATVLDSSSPPSRSRNCSFCAYLSSPE